jgi:hypothetical protein
MKPLSLQLSIVTTPGGAVTLSEHALALINNLKQAGNLFVITEKSGTLHELLLTAPGAHNLLVLPNEKAELLLPVAKEIQHRTLLVCNSTQMLQYSLAGKFAAIIPEPSLLAPGGWLTGFGHHAVLYYLYDKNIHVISHPYAFWQLPGDATIATALHAYLGAYDFLFPGLWLVPEKAEKKETKKV